ncbi:MAG: type II toxin-antitoxin system ParD family antitoxin [Sinimarinibacterium flocculans]|uniref:type II toxin-antitoxin system ParD family antitoxin n=1 Tax=Sinimarinibacterium flocculans TaxID=985250 RepID=UPI000EE77443|nr:type II toxin-antitoxin system ParD family antitoxin [Sinimarinibacterium flocculans]HCO42663.1 type II toxin-antitoxin system ParD family antitoxin [Gammaproteobacteria bacterium]
MATMNISLTDDLKAFVDQQVAEHAYASTSEYLRDLIRKQRDIEKLRGLLLEGFNSGPAEPVTPETFKQMREELRERVRK